MIKKIILGAIRILGYMLVFIITAITIIFAFTFGVVWLGDSSGGFTP